MAGRDDLRTRRGVAPGGGSPDPVGSALRSESGLPRRPLGRATAIAAAAVAVGAILVACGDGRSSTGGGAAAGSLSAPAARGERIALESGCAACHGRAWEGGAGPALVGLAGSTVTLADGTTIIADRDYLTRSLADPSAEISGNFSMKMPPNGLTDEQVADVVAFIEAIGAESTAGAAG